MPFSTKMTALSAGGYNNCVAYDPTLQGHIIAGGDTFGFNESFDGGLTWHMANLGLPNNTAGNGGVCGIAFDPVTGLSYAGMGIAPTVVVGTVISDGAGNKFTRWAPAATNPGGFFGGGNATWLPAGDTRPRATGNVIEVDNFGGTRYVYAQPWKNGIWRSTNDYASAVNIYSDTATIGQQLNGIVLDPTDKTRLLVGRWGYGDGKTGAAQIGNIRAAGAGAATYLSLSNAPPSVLEWCVIGTRVYAAASWGGVYRVSQTGGNWNTWTPMNLGLTLGTAGVSGQPIYCGLTGYNDGTHDVLFVCCANPPHIGAEYSAIWRNPQAELATNAVSTWQNLVATATNVFPNVLGSGEQWWLKAADSAFMLGGSVGDMENLAIDPFNTNRVHVVGRAGGWQTQNASSTASAVQWRPCVNGQGGTTTWMLVADPTRPNHFYTTNVDHVLVSTTDDFKPATIFKNKPAGGSNQGTWGDMGPDGLFYLGVGDRDTPTINGEVFRYNGDPNSSASTSLGLAAAAGAGNKPQGLAITGTASAPVVLAGVYNKGIIRRVVSTWTVTLSAALLDPVPSKTNHFPTAKDADTNTIYFGGPDTGIFRSLDRGATWPQAGGGANGLWWNRNPAGFTGLSLGCDPSVAGRLYICFNNGVWRVDSANVAGTLPASTAVRITPPVGPLTAVQGMAIDRNNGWVYVTTTPTTGVDAGLWECQNPAAGLPVFTQADDGFGFASAAYSLNWMAVDNQGGQIMLMPGGVFEADFAPLQTGGGAVWDSPTATWNSASVAWDGGTVDPTHKRGQGAITGTATLSAGGKVKTRAMGALVGTGTLSATGTVGTRISAAIVGTGTLAATGHLHTKGRGAIVGTGTLGASGTTGGVQAPAGDRQFRIGKRTGGSRLGGRDRIGGRLGHVGLAAVQFHVGGATASRIGGIDRIGGLSTFVTDTFNGVGAIIGTGTLSANGKVRHHGIGNITGTGTLGATAKRKVRGIAAVSGQGSLIATGRKRTKGRGTLSGTGTLAAVATSKVKGHGSLVGTGTLSARGQIAGRISADLLGRGTLTASGGHITIHGRGAIAGGGTLSAKSTFSRGVGAIVGTGTLLASAHQTSFGQLQMLGVGILTATGTIVPEGHGADFGPTRVLIGVGGRRTTGDFWGEHDDPP